MLSLMVHFDYSSIVFQYKSYKIVILQYKWNYVNTKIICVIILFISPVLDLIWRSDMVVKDHQQNPPSLTFPRPKQKAKSLVVDQELLLCRIYFINAVTITKYSSVI
jgi:hypothetical protein